MTSPAVSRDWPRPHPAKNWLDRWAKLFPVMIFLAVLLLYPVAQLFALSFQTPAGAFTLDQYVRLFSSDVYLNIMLITLKIATYTTIAAIICSYPVAYLITTRAGVVKSQVLFWVLLAFWTSFLVRTFGWLVLLGRNGLINQWLTGLHLLDTPAGLLYSLPSVVLGMTHAMVPLCILTMVSVMDTIDPSLPRAGLTLGARPGSAFWRIYFPLSLPGVAAGGLLVFITSLGFFITPAFLGSRFETMITQVIIEQVQELLNWPFAGALSLLLLVAALIIFYCYDRILGLSTLAGESVQKDRGGGTGPGWTSRAGFRICEALGRITDAVASGLGKLLPQPANRAPRSLSSLVQWPFVVAILVFLGLPAFIMIPVSFTGGGAIAWPPQGFSLRWYESFFNSAVWVQAATRSLVVAVGAAGIAMLIGAPAAFVIARQQMRGKSIVLGLILAPLIIPRMIIAVALFYLYSRIGLVGTYLGLILGHAVLAIPYVVITVMAALKNYDERYEKAAWNLGAGRLRALIWVTLPLIRAGLVSAFLFALITSFDELTIALFVTGGLTTTLPKQMWDDAILSVSPTLAAASTLLLIFVTILIILAELLQRKKQGGSAAA